MLRSREQPTLVRPGSGVDAGQNVGLTAVYDSYNHLMRGVAGSNEEQHYRYDPFGRRIAAMELSTTTIPKGRRYVYDGSRVVEERMLEAIDGGSTTLADGHSRLERIYVVGSILFSAIDYNRDGDIADDLNSTECSWSGGVAGKDTADAAFYFLTNRMGSTAALLDKNSDRKVLEYYRYRSYGEVTVLTVLDDGTSPGTASDGIEDTPSDLGDNPTRRISKFANALTFTGRRLDDATGVMYYRHRMYDPVSGRFVSRDPLDYFDSINLYQSLGSSVETDSLMSRGLVTDDSNGQNSFFNETSHYSIEDWRTVVHLELNPDIVSPIEAAREVAFGDGSTNLNKYPNDTTNCTRDVRTRKDADADCPAGYTKATDYEVVNGKTMRVYRCIKCSKQSSCNKERCRIAANYTRDRPSAREHTCTCSDQPDQAYNS